MSTVDALRSLLRDEYILLLSICLIKFAGFHKMAASKSSAMTQLNDITECCICLKMFTDPRMLPCIHTFCFQCLQDMAEKSHMIPGDQIQCPVCRKEFIVPNDGVQGVQKNFFMANLIELRNAFKEPNMALPCDICNANNAAANSQIPEATMRCLSCQANLCEDCCKMHKTSKMWRNHEILKIGSEVVEEQVLKSLQVMNCDIHHGKVLDYYCADCKKVVCVSCFVESHRTHDCKDVNTVEEEFRERIENNAHTISTLAGELLAKRKKMENKEEFCKKIAAKESEILQRGKELRDMIDEHTKSVLSSLDEIKNRHLKEIQMEEEELDRRFTIMESFSRYCDELSSKGSASEVCRSKDELLRRADELEEDHEEYIMRPLVSFGVSFQATEIENFLTTRNGNIIGQVLKNVDHLEDFLGLADVYEGASDSVSYKMNLHRQNDVDYLTQNIPTAVRCFPAAVVYNDTMFVIGVGITLTEIWKFHLDFGWKKCGSLVQEREKHCVERIGETLYMCGGSWKGVMIDYIEAYNALTEKSTKVGQLRFGSQFATCVAYKGSIYVFGGLDKDAKPLDCVQVYNPVKSTCTLLLAPTPRPYAYMQAVLWRKTAILLGSETCFIFDFEDKIWQERKQFKAETVSFGMVRENERIFSIGGAPKEAGAYEDHVKYIRVSSIVKNEAATWKTHYHMPKLLLALTYIVNDFIIK